MLTIRPGQLHAFEAEALAQFAARNVVRLAARYGPWCSAIGRAALRSAVNHGIARAEAYGVIEDATIERWLDLCVLLGCGFADDPLLPWASRELAASAHDCDARVQRVYDLAEDWLQRTAGSAGEHTEGALQRVVDRPAQWWTARDDADVLARVAEIDPIKYDALAREGLLPRLVERARSIAVDAEMADARGLAIVGVATFMLGSGFPTDPQLPWVTTAWNAPPPARAESLLREAKALATRVLRGVDREVV